MPELGFLRSAAVNPGPEIVAPAGLEALAPLIDKRMADAAHGDLPRWRTALGSLPDLAATDVWLDGMVYADGPVLQSQRIALENALAGLRPWRKGPFSLFGVTIHSEWRSDWKWRRVVPHLEPLRGHRVLDVGCGNGYFGWRMLQAGASEVIGVDPNPLFCLQHQAVNQYVRSEHNHVLPLRFEDLNGAEATFDSVFSMGVVYHRHEPAEHVEQLFSHVRPGGQIVLESLVVREQRPLIPEGRYARMRNVRIVPTPELMQHWLESAGFREVRLADVTVTGRDEQRTTPWMPFESLAEALDQDDPSRTVEGHPAPVRAVVIARKPVQSIPPPPTGQPLT